MDTNVVATLFLLALPLLLYRFFYRSNQNIPSVSILEYLPNGVLHPILKDTQNLTRVVLAMVKQHGDVFYSWLGMRNTLYTAVREDVVQVLTSETFIRPDMIHNTYNAAAPGGILTMSSEVHLAARKTMQAHFNATMLQGFEPSMNAAIMELCKDLEDVARDLQQDGTPRVIDMSAMLLATPLRIITNVAFGSRMDRKQREEFRQILNTYMQELPAEIMGYPFRQYLTFLGLRKRFFDCKAKVDNMCKAFIQRRIAESKEERNARSPDMLDVFLDMKSEDENSVLSFVVEFAVAGSYSVTQILSWCIYETCCNGRAMTKIDAELELVLGSKPLDEPITLQELSKLGYIHKVWRETLRIHPVGVGIIKECTSEVTLKGSGIRIPKGTNVLAVFAALHLDARLWSEPHVFKPERWGYGDVRGEGERAPAGSFVPFSLGRRGCGGQFLANCEGPLMLAELHRRFKFSLACKPEEIVSCASFVETPRYASKQNGELDMGVPVRVEMKHASA